MKKLLFALLILACASSAQATTINYDGTGYQYPTQIGNYYAALPASPVHSAGFMWLDYGGSIDYNYGPHSLTAMAFAYRDNPVWVSWSAPVSGVSLWYGWVNNALSVEGYLGSTLVFSSGALPKNSNGMFQYVAPSVSIDKLVLNGTPNYWTMDDLSYTSGGNVPDAGSSLILLGMGLAGLRAWKRRVE